MDELLPLYLCHKKVRATKIIKLEPAAGDRPAGPNDETDGGAIITPAEVGFGRIRVDRDYVKKHSPTVGGYYVIYEDGYKSFSPAKAFEEGYTRADESR